MEQEVLRLATQGVSDETIATRLTDNGYRSPMRAIVLPTTVQKIRLAHGILHKAHQSHARRVPGYLSVAQIARQLGVSVHWGYDRIHNGRIRIVKDPRVRGYLFPDNATLLDRLRLLKHGEVSQVRVDDTSDPVPDVSEQMESARSSPKTPESSSRVNQLTRCRSRIVERKTARTHGHTGHTAQGIMTDTRHNGDVERGDRNPTQSRRRYPNEIRS
jgi:hypothetical protein